MILPNTEARTFVQRQSMQLCSPAGPVLITQEVAHFAVFHHALAPHTFALPSHLVHSSTQVPSFPG